MGSCFGVNVPLDVSGEAEDRARRGREEESISVTTLRMSAERRELRVGEHGFETN